MSRWATIGNEMMITRGIHPDIYLPAGSVFQMINNAAAADAMRAATTAAK